ncbi:MAG: methyltransferase domain-containing protein [Actinomycetaceae bacterium]|nr:methyltransferase domain-containing protein [Actinomycetaceae bacterium]
MDCPHFQANECTSCTHLDLPYKKTIRDKDMRVRQLLSDHTIQWLDPCHSPTTGYRNKAKLAVNGTYAHPVLGIVDKTFNGIDLTKCTAYEKELHKLFPVLSAFITRAQLTPFHVPTNKGELKYIIASVSPEKKFLLRFVLRSTEAEVRIRKHLPWLYEQIGEGHVITINLLPERKAVTEGNTEIILSSETELRMKINDIDMYLPPKSFFQTNTHIASQLYQQVRTWIRNIAKTKPEIHIWDLFCGVGGFALHAYTPHNRITGIEISEEAIQSARHSADVMGAHNIEFISGDATKIAQDYGTPDIIIANPPRRGITTLTTLLEKLQPQWIIYSSCNPTTLHTDIQKMPSYTPIEARNFDMFPFTNHIETAVLMSRMKD